MSQLGIGAIIHAMFGGSQHGLSEYVGLVIVSAAIDEECLVLGFDNGKRIKIFDNGQSCCESRYMRTDDDIGSLVGHKLTRIEAKSGPDLNAKNDDDEYSCYGEEHETCFVEVGTDDGFVTIVNHNEHNGYYGGFGLSIEEIE